MIDMQNSEVTKNRAGYDPNFRDKNLRVKSAE